jgi:hypothetical protein
MMPEQWDQFMTHVEFEHAFRNRLNQYSDYIRNRINDDGDPGGNMRIKYYFEYGGWETTLGTWGVNTWGNATPDLHTKGAVFIDVVEAHIRRVREQMELAKLPALLEAQIITPAQMLTTTTET